THKGEPQRFYRIGSAKQEAVRQGRHKTSFPGNAAHSLYIFFHCRSRVHSEIEQNSSFTPRSLPIYDPSHRMTQLLDIAAGFTGSAVTHVEKVPSEDSANEASQGATFSRAGDHPGPDPEETAASGPAAASG